MTHPCHLDCTPCEINAPAEVFAAASRIIEGRGFGATLSHLIWTERDPET
jgi:hypothetical protein